MTEPLVGQFPIPELQKAFSAARREQLTRILDRCRADLEHPLLAIGTGSHSTLKRATALRMASEGVDVETIAGAASLSASRVQQVLGNVLASGMEALYPRFAENLAIAQPLDVKKLWKIIKPVLDRQPKASGIAGELWRPSMVADYLVHTGAVEDASVSQIASIIERFKDKGVKGSVEVMDVGIEKKTYFTFAENQPRSQKRIAPFQLSLGFFFVFLLFMFWIDYSRHFENMSTLTHVMSLLFMGVGAIVMALLIVKQTLEWWLLLKVLASSAGGDGTALSAAALLRGWVRRDLLGHAENGKVPARSARGMLVSWLHSNVPFLKAKDAAEPALQEKLPPGSQPVNPLGAPRVTILHSQSLPATPWEIDNMTDERNAMGEAPLRTLYLWVFDAQEEQAVFETHGWPQLGPVHLLLNSTALPLKQLVHPGKDLLLRAPADVDKAIVSYGDSAGTHARPSLFEQIGLLKGSTYLGYPIHTPVCTDGSWEHALHALAERCGLAVVNLSGYDPSHPGLEYEIRHLLSGGPPQQFLFTYDYQTDADAVIDSVLDVWFGLAEPPAAAPTLLFLRTTNAEDENYQAQFRAREEKNPKMKGFYEKKAGDYFPVAGRAVAYLRKAPSHEAERFPV